jgi:4'-phosphopantetheinyl transferase
VNEAPAPVFMTTAPPAVPSELVWAPAPENLKLGKGELLVFSASLELNDSRLAELALSLSEDERARAVRLRFDRDRRRFIAGRGLLRELLGWLLRVEASQLAFGYTARGKPVLAAPASGHALHFNVAHADSLALYAVAWEHEVGIDIERLRPIMGADAIAERFFSDREFAQWRSVSSRQQIEAFFNCWTRKEACLKATGDGISESLDQVEVSLIPGQPVRLLRIPCDPRAATRWLLRSLSLGGYLGAVAAPQGSDLKVSCWRWGR